MTAKGLICEFQSTRPRGARRGLWPGCAHGARVSIHAPAWGATRPRRDVQECHAVSIHAPAWGATCATAGQSIPTAGFNPRARVGRDLPPVSLNSIYALFQSTRPRGARLGMKFPAFCIDLFQSTRPRGARRALSLVRVYKACFNPRARVGRDGSAEKSRPPSARFQSTRPRGARLLLPCISAR